ncbi:LOW QUALITY PROTEIN: scavenger receptor cysteine-rich type 1 protein M130-like [Myiozetetes cayanensis]|uniref:LOW QUALITY PROTEIN: scavenger receptor cysteine-rich type 1 protein M130-like n=1 Tax=Myiozetetes cayanensis TaxID=478635 RepID=UPI00215EF5AA|nr:LOW QUALITY PROTEIN: scavenger receptor cysteine-rich type 1 protein M130-like [Myiozetetes cayanensis]
MGSVGALELLLCLQLCGGSGQLRLVGGGGRCAGRVEVNHSGEWGSVCVFEFDWEARWATVVCRQLGCGSAIGAYAARDRFGAGAGPINLAVVDCKGDEATLWDCEIRGWGPYNGSHDFDTAVVCQGFSRLVGRDGACAGQLEVWQHQAWVGMCAEHVDMKGPGGVPGAAQVVCRELGCGTALAIPGSGRFGAGMGLLWEGGFTCTGNETLLSTCAQQVPHSQGCAGHATIICSPYTGFRLGSSSSGCAGRVEVAVRGTWGSVCATDWDLPDAEVLCLHLGCGHAVTVPPGGSFGSGDGPLRPDAFGCSGSERHPGECPVAVLGEPPCTPGNAAAVNCSGVVNSLQLVEGESRCDGRLEEAITTPTWRRVPVEQWKTWDVYMVCSVLYCGLPSDVYSALRMAPTALTSSSREVDVMVKEMDDMSGKGPHNTNNSICHFTQDGGSCLCPRLLRGSESLPENISVLA